MSSVQQAEPSMAQQAPAGERTGTQPSLVVFTRLIRWSAHTQLLHKQAVEAGQAPAASGQSRQGHPRPRCDTSGQVSQLDTGSTRPSLSLLRG